MGPPGHLAIGLFAKPAITKAPLWVLLLATEILDILSFGFVAFGLETLGDNRIDLKRGLPIITVGTIHWSHGLFMSIIWACLISVIAYLVFRDGREAGVIGLLVFSHWILDLIVHPPDLPLFFSGITISRPRALDDWSRVYCLNDLGDYPLSRGYACIYECKKKAIEIRTMNALS